LKIAIAGKGGVGKTFIAGTLARLFARAGRKVIVVDADPNINTASSLGISAEVSDSIVPLSDNEELIKEKTGVAPGQSYGQLFRLTPSVNDVIDEFGVMGPDGVRLLVMGTVKGGNTGCMCPANALLRILIQHLLIQRDEVLIMDMVAGLEHLGRGTARRMDAMLVIVEPRMKSIDTMRRIMKLATDIEVKEVIAVGNKIGSLQEQKFIEEKMRELNVPVAALVPYDEAIAKADMMGKASIDNDPISPGIKAVEELSAYLKKRYG
jgi:CO dehydrogenase maturation factor